jgi:hypothetical protein
MSYKVIPQVEFDKAVQKVLATGISRTPAENIVLSFWKISQDENFDFKQFLDKALSTGKLDVDQTVLDYINASLPDTIRYRKENASRVAPIAQREL